MKYASVRSMDISNGENVGVSLFVQGCPEPHCSNCFNPETWDFNGGKEWTEETENKFIKLASRPYIQRISILGGEPLADQNLDGVLKLVNKIRVLLPDKIIWLYSRFTWEQIMYPIVTDDFNPKREEMLQKRRDIISQCDILIDGRYIDSQRDVSLKWRGSANQRVIDVKESLKQDKVVLYCD